MNVAAKRVLLDARKAYRKLAGSEDIVSYAAVEVSGQAASNLVRARLAASEPAMIARLGSAELGCVVNYLGMRDDRPALRRALAFVTGRGGSLWWEERNLNDVTQVAGFFPRDPAMLERLCERYLEDMQSVDILGSWLAGERSVASYLDRAVRVRLDDLEPYYHAHPWSEVLAGKTVLVVHPFAETIAAQYARRTELFADPRVLPDFELRILKAVQSAASTDTPFRTWADAYEHMCDEMEAIEFDVALIGAGAYGFPLAAHAKRMGRKAVHLGGATQILFGIRGRRWDAHAIVSTLYNEYWVRPLESERPSNYFVVDGGSYW